MATQPVTNPWLSFRYIVKVSDDDGSLVVGHVPIGTITLFSTTESIPPGWLLWNNRSMTIVKTILRGVDKTASG